MCKCLWPVWHKVSIIIKTNSSHHLTKWPQQKHTDHSLAVGTPVAQELVQDLDQLASRSGHGLVVERVRRLSSQHPPPGLQPVLVHPFHQVLLPRTQEHPHHYLRLSQRSDCDGVAHSESISAPSTGSVVLSQNFFSPTEILADPISFLSLSQCLKNIFINCKVKAKKTRFESSHCLLLCLKTVTNCSES